MWWPLRLRRLQVILTPVVLAVGLLLVVPLLLLVREQRRRDTQQRKTALVASRFVGRVHTDRGLGTHADPQQCREPSKSAGTAGRLPLPRVGRSAGARQIAARAF